MVSIITTASSCMACTTPVLNESVFDVKDSNPNNQTHNVSTENMYEEYFTRYYNRQRRGRVIDRTNDPIIVIDGTHRSQYQKMMFRQNRPSIRYNRGKVNKMNRSYGNIHQPGRTNCTQRFQSK